jgi:hypothetical protein
MKLVLLLIPVIILSILAMRLFSARGLFFKKGMKGLSNQIVTCCLCGISVHESLIVKKDSKIYCSENCANS